MSEPRDWGWISVHRTIFDNWLWEEKPFSKGQAWIDLLLLANSSDRKVPFGKKLVLVKRGEKMISMRQLEQRWGWSNNKVKNFLNILQDDGMINYKCTTKNTVYSIVNYNDYQDKNNEKSITEAYQKHNESITEAYQKHTNNKINNINNINKIDKIHSEKFINIWNENFNSKINEKQFNQSINQLIASYSIDEVLSVLDKATKSNYLLGKTETNKKGMTLNFFSKVNNFEKIKSGKYDNHDNYDVKTRKSKKTDLSSLDDRTSYEERQEFYKQKLKEKIPIKIKNK